MSREIRFRAWDKRGKKWADPKYIQIINGQVSLRYCEVLQYTGLKDKNSKEIFEGDIVKTIYDTVGEITFEECPGYIAKDKHFYGSPIYGWSIKEKCNYPHKEYNHRGFNTVREVIGNIYSNPELLETSSKLIDAIKEADKELK